MFDKPAQTQTPIHDLLAKRWSGRAYDSARAVSQEQLLSILEAGRWALSCFNDQPWRYLIWDRIQDQVHWNKAFACLAEGNQQWAKNAPILMLAVAHSQFDHNAKPNRWAQHDTGAASENICLQATALGLMAHQMGGFDADKISQEFAIPNQYTATSMITIGYQASIDSLDEDIRVREMEPRQRKSLGDICFSNTWGNAINKE